MIAFAFHFTVENQGVSFCLFLPQMSYVLLWNERWSSFVFCQFTYASKLLYFKALELCCHCIVQRLHWRYLLMDLPF